MFILCTTFGVDIYLYYFVITINSVVFSLLTDLLFPGTGVHGLSLHFPALLLHLLAARHTPDTPKYKGPSPNAGIKGFIVNSPVSKTASPPWVRSPTPQSTTETPAGQKTLTGDTPFASSTPALPLLPLPPSKGTPSTTRSEASRAWLNRYAMRAGLRSRAGLDARQMDRPVQHHTFLADVADVRQIEQGLLQLMEDFQAGSLRAFGKLILLCSSSVFASVIRFLHYLITLLLFPLSVMRDKRRSICDKKIMIIKLRKT